MVNVFLLAWIFTTLFEGEISEKHMSLYPAFHIAQHLATEEYDFFVNIFFSGCTSRLQLYQRVW